MTKTNAILRAQYRLYDTSLRVYIHDDGTPAAPCASSNWKCYSKYKFNQTTEKAQSQINDVKVLSLAIGHSLCRFMHMLKYTKRMRPSRHTKEKRAETEVDSRLVLTVWRAAERSWRFGEDLQTKLVSLICVERDTGKEIEVAREP